MTMMTDTHSDVAAVLAAIEEARPANGGVIELEPGDPLYEELPDVTWRSLSAVGDRELIHVARAYRTDGAEVPIRELPAGFWESLRKRLGYGVYMWFTASEMHALLHEDLLIVSAGCRSRGRLVERDGVPGVELLMPAEARRRARAEDDEFLEAHPEILTLTPSWALEVTLDGEHLEGMGLCFSRDLGLIECSRTAVFKDGTVVFDDGTSAPSVFVQIEDESDPVKLREYAAALVRAAELIEASR